MPDTTVMSQDIGNYHVDLTILNRNGRNSYRTTLYRRSGAEYVVERQITYDTEKQAENCFTKYCKVARKEMGD